MISQTLGHHRSNLCDSAVRFKARIHCAELGKIQILQIRGQGSVELVREQCDNAVLWLPMHGASEETINGRPRLAEPGTALLFRAGDAMRGLTSEHVAGISLVIPSDWLPPAAETADPLIAAGVAAQGLLQAAHEVALAAASGEAGGIWAANTLENALQLWAQSCLPQSRRERITATRRRQCVSRTREWILAHLHRPFTVAELAAALGLSIRQLQYNVLSELGRTPMAEARRLQLHHLRTLLRQHEEAENSIGNLMEKSGLQASGASAAAISKLVWREASSTRRKALGDHCKHP
ncbi:MAG: hypothetical protein ACKO0M_03720 [Cyanobium sp.]